MILKPDLSSPELCRTYLSLFELDGEKIGFIVNAKTGEEVKLTDATDEQIMSAALMLSAMIDKSKGIQEH